MSRHEKDGTWSELTKFEATVFRLINSILSNMIYIYGWKAEILNFFTLSGNIFFIEEK